MSPLNPVISGASSRYGNYSVLLLPNIRCPDQRGIDPIVDDPNHCHGHSDVPEKDEDWPTLETIIRFRDAVRRRLLGLYDELATGKRALSRTVARMLFMTHEHEGFHVEVDMIILSASLKYDLCVSSADSLIHAYSKSRLRHPPSTRIHPSSLEDPLRTMDVHTSSVVTHSIYSALYGYAWP